MTLKCHLNVINSKTKIVFILKIGDSLFNIIKRFNVT